MNLASRISIPDGYLVAQLEMREKALWEALDYDAFLVEWIERRLLYSCWFDHYSCPDTSRHFMSLTLSDLFDAGWRLNGVVYFDEPQLSTFLDRFGGAGKRWTDGFEEHMSEHIIMGDQSVMGRFAGVRAQIFDLTIVEYAMRALTYFPDQPRR